jgi:hypothetical protein
MKNELKLPFGQHVVVSKDEPVCQKVKVYEVPFINIIVTNPYGTNNVQDIRHSV